MDSLVQLQLSLLGEAFATFFAVEPLIDGLQMVREGSLREEFFVAMSAGKFFCRTFQTQMLLKIGHRVERIHAAMLTPMGIVFNVFLLDVDTQSGQRRVLTATSPKRARMNRLMGQNVQLHVDQLAGG